VARLDKLAKCVALYDQFHTAIAHLDHPSVTRLVTNWEEVRNQFAAPDGGSRSAFASGMEQGLRETPFFLGSMPTEMRKFASEALATATRTHYPEFLAKEAARIGKVKERGAIRTENEFYLIRHQIDILEGTFESSDELNALRWLADKFEDRRK
jgi:hypothetical protein